MALVVYPMLIGQVCIESWCQATGYLPAEGSRLPRNRMLTPDENLLTGIGVPYKDTEVPNKKPAALRAPESYHPFDVGHRRNGSDNPPSSTSGFSTDTMDSSSVTTVRDTVAPSHEMRWSLLIHPLLRFCRSLFGFVYIRASSINESAKDAFWILSGGDRACFLLVLHVLIELLVLMASYYTCERNSSPHRSRVSLIHSFELAATIAELMLVAVLAGLLLVSLIFRG